MGSQNHLCIVKQRKYASAYDRRRFQAETAALRLLDKHSFYAAPALHQADHNSLSLVLDWIDGSPLTRSKFAPHLPDETIHLLVNLATSLEGTLRPLADKMTDHGFTQPADWLGLPWSKVPNDLSGTLTAGRLPTAPAHGDLFPRNVLRVTDAVIPIDWEWFGSYPIAWDLATAVVATLFHPTTVEAVAAVLAGRPTAEQTAFIAGLAVLCIREATGRWTPPPRAASTLLWRRGQQFADLIPRWMREPGSQPIAYLLATSRTPEEETHLLAPRLTTVTRKERHP